MKLPSAAISTHNRPSGTRPQLDRAGLIDRFRRTRARSRAVFDLVSEDVRLERPIALRHPIIFYEGHIPAFYVNTLLKKGLGLRGIDEALERLFARGIDPDSEAAADERRIAQWPAREELDEFVLAADAAIEGALANADIDRPTNPVLRDAQAVWTSLEHEAMHQETLLYILHRLPHEAKRRPPTATTSDARGVGRREPFEFVAVPAGHATLGLDRDAGFGWDNEFDEHTVHVPAFGITRRKVTNADWLEFIDAGGYRQQILWTPADWEWVTSSGLASPPFWVRRDGRWYWHGMFEDVALPPEWPVYVTQAEAAAFARWKGGRLPTEAEFHRSAFGAPDGEERALPWGDAPPDSTRGHVDFAGWDPAPVGTHPAGASAWGIDEPIGNGWEWTSTVFGPFTGFEPMPSYPEYSADFFDGQHYVMKGASPATARELIRRSFRNWFRPQYPYVYAGFRVVREGDRWARAR
jgi:gamma-glutamyl hercynylcysteine S-oxide synthase